MLGWEMEESRGSAAVEEGREAVEEGREVSCGCPSACAAEPTDRRTDLDEEGRVAESTEGRVAAEVEGPRSERERRWPPDCMAMCGVGSAVQPVRCVYVGELVGVGGQYALMSSV